MDDNNDRYNRDDICRQMQADEIGRCSDSQQAAIVLLPKPAKWSAETSEYIAACKFIKGQR
jgi:hypothetical protein